MKAMHPELVATLKSLGNQELAGRLAQHLGPLAILGGTSVADVAAKLLESLPVGPDGDAGGTVKALPGKKKASG
jgi:hypothetical protein